MIRSLQTMKFALFVAAAFVVIPRLLFASVEVDFSQLAPGPVVHDINAPLQTSDSDWFSHNVLLSAVEKITAGVSRVSKSLKQLFADNAYVTAQITEPLFRLSFDHFGKTLDTNNRQTLKLLSRFERGADRTLAQGRSAGLQVLAAHRNAYSDALSFATDSIQNRYLVPRPITTNLKDVRDTAAQNLVFQARIISHNIEEQVQAAAVATAFQSAPRLAQQKINSVFDRAALYIDDGINSTATAVDTAQKVNLAEVVTKYKVALTGTELSELHLGSAAQSLLDAKFEQQPEFVFTLPNQTEQDSVLAYADNVLVAFDDVMQVFVLSDLQVIQARIASAFDVTITNLAMLDYSTLKAGLVIPQPNFDWVKIADQQAQVYLYALGENLGVAADYLVPRAHGLLVVLNDQSIPVAFSSNGSFLYERAVGELVVAKIQNRAEGRILGDSTGISWWQKVFQSFTGISDVPYVYRTYKSEPAHSHLSHGK